jgi:diguanylate cyclase (GGDEF)-like protein
MSAPRTTHASVWPAFLAVVAFACSAGAWWWSIRLTGANVLQWPALVGLVGGLGALGASVWLQRDLQRSDDALQRAKRYKPYVIAQRKQVSSAKVESLKARLLLSSTLDTMEVGLDIWDEQDHLVLYNNKINPLPATFYKSTDIGQPFESLLRKSLKQQLIPAAIGHEEEWLAQRLALRGKSKEPLLQEIAGNRWINTYESRTPEGYLVSARLDVTELVRHVKALEARNHQLTYQTVTDALTGLANRRRFDQALINEWQRTSRSLAPLSLLMVDIDHFKSYNDHYGHLAGDECLRKVAQALSQCVRRAGELVARYGGEEFVMLLPGADLTQARETAQKCMEQMRSEALPHAASPTCEQVTLSIGVACVLPDATLEPADMVNAADAAMYRAKSTGRAHFEVATQSDWEIDKDTPRSNPVPLN